ncbi:hypothetical protein COCON_G00051620 [Conger conger]|uniref:Uncharacterized protein n=1 Tax=Conger conger TaxID=82655 RepID=A0A9Q1I5P4_CONCO|nr:hypothetical protein COCON_G00051620 [Conger conger]
MEREQSIFRKCPPFPPPLLDALFICTICIPRTQIYTPTFPVFNQQTELTFFHNRDCQYTIRKTQLKVFTQHMLCKTKRYSSLKHLSVVSLLAVFKEYAAYPIIPNNLHIKQIVAANIIFSAQNFLMRCVTVSAYRSPPSFFAHFV